MGKDDLKQVIAQGKLDEAVAHLLEQIKTYSTTSKSDKFIGQLSDVLIINSGKLHGLQSDKMLGIVGRQNEHLTLVQVQQAILYVLDELPNEFWNTTLQHPRMRQHSGNEQTELLEAVENLKQGQSNFFDYDIFVSFSSLDREVLQPVVEKLRGYGLRVFISDQNLIEYAGEVFAQTIENALENSKHFILVSSPNSVKSYWVEIEWITFFNQFHVNDRKNRRIFVLKGIDFDLNLVPLFLRNMQIAENAEQIVHTLVAKTKAQQREREIQVKNDELRQQRLTPQKAEEERIEKEKQARFLDEQLLKEKQQKVEQDRLEQQIREEKEAQKRQAAKFVAEQAAPEAEEFISLNVTTRSINHFPKIFISYSYKDHQVALRIKQKLTKVGLEVIIDVDAMYTGENIAGFIKKCMQQSGITLSLVSPNSLMSAWVAMETIWSTYDETLRGRYFMPCTIDNSFFKYSFTDEALDVLDDQTTEIKNTIMGRLQKGRGIEDLTEELTRINRLKNELPAIVGKLKNSLCVNLNGDNFEHGMDKVINDIIKLFKN